MGAALPPQHCLALGNYWSKRAKKNALETGDHICVGFDQHMTKTKKSEPKPEGTGVSILFSTLGR
jgi:hypothetical protein